MVKSFLIRSCKFLGTFHEQKPTFCFFDILHPSHHRWLPLFPKTQNRGTAMCLSRKSLSQCFSEVQKEKCFDSHLIFDPSEGTKKDLTIRRASKPSSGQYLWPATDRSGTIRKSGGKHPEGCEFSCKKLRQLCWVNPKNLKWPLNSLLACSRLLKPNSSLDFRNSRLAGLQCLKWSNSVGHHACI